MFVFHWIVEHFFYRKIQLEQIFAWICRSFIYTSWPYILLYSLIIRLWIWLDKQVNLTSAKRGSIYFNEYNIIMQLFFVILKNSCYSVLENSLVIPIMNFLLNTYLWCFSNINILDWGQLHHVLKFYNRSLVDFSVVEHIFEFY